MKMAGSMFSADLGGSSKYSNENFEDRSGEGFHEKQHLVMGYSILRHREIPCNTMRACSQLPKGKEVNIPLAGCGYCGNTNKPGDGSRKS